jgi:predicted transcriptional regulator
MLLTETRPAVEFVEMVSRSGIPMADVCRKAGVAQSTPSRWKGEGWEPKTRTLRKMIEAFEELRDAKATADAAQAQG